METAEEPVKKTKFQSPLPFLIRLRNLIFGKKRPDIYTLVTFYINLALTLTFLLWCVVGYVAVASRNYIFEEKGVPVESIIQRRGVELGFQPEDFVSRIMTFNAIGAICWGVVLFGLILLYRKRRQFSYFVFGGLLFYIGMIIFYLSFRYFMDDTTLFDKISLLIVGASAGIHAFLMRNERKGGSISFFGEAD